MKTKRRVAAATILRAGLAVLAALAAGSVHAAPVYWAEWQTGTVGPEGTASGTMKIGSATVKVEYKGEIGFLQTSSGGEPHPVNCGGGAPCDSDWWVEPDNGSVPFTSSLVDNRPPRLGIIALSRATSKTLTFSQPVQDLLFAVVSLNGNGYRFDRDFEIVSFGSGYWGDGTLTKVNPEPGVYQLNGDGEPHGVIRFKGRYSSFTWTSLTDEFWNGFTVGTLGLAGKGSASALATAGGPGGGGRQASPSRSSRHCSGPKTTGAGDPIDIKLGGDLLFDFDKATLRPEADGMLSEVAQQLRELGGRPLLIEGHTDDAGSEPYNRKLSQARAAAVAEWMATKGGIEAGCMRAVGYWYSRPAAPNDSEEGRQKNRRVEIHSDRTPAAGGSGT